jgi:hypothetical protein
MGQYTHDPQDFVYSDSRGWLRLFDIIGSVSWLFLGFMVLIGFAGKDREKDYFGLLYWIAYLIWTLIYPSHLD